MGFRSASGVSGPAVWLHLPPSATSPESLRLLAAPVCFAMRAPGEGQGLGLGGDH